MGGLKTCSIDISPSVRLTDPGKVDSCTFIVDPSVPFTVDNPTKVIEREAADKRKLVSKWHPTTKGTLRRNYRILSKTEGRCLLKAIASLLSDDDHFRDATSHKKLCCNNVRALFDELPTPHLIVEITPFPAGPLIESDYARAEKLEKVLRPSSAISVRPPQVKGNTRPNSLNTSEALNPNVMLNFRIINQPISTSFRGTLTLLLSMRWTSECVVTDGSKLFFQVPLKYTALAKMSLVSLLTASAGRTPLIRPLVCFSAHEFTSMTASTGMVATKSFEDGLIEVEKKLEECFTRIIKVEECVAQMHQEFSLWSDKFFKSVEAAEKEKKSKLIQATVKEKKNQELQVHSSGVQRDQRYHKRRRARLF
nr:uncharacterized protein [Tanacetum cinerariifolium]